MASREVATLDLASLEHFQTELIAAGFEPRPDNPRRWRGPIADSLKDLTRATTMEIVFVDGWPFRPPLLYVSGLDEWHLSAEGQICLWTTGASSGEWLTLAGYVQRIAEWVERAKNGFRPEDFALDAHLSFGNVRPGAIATVDLNSLRLDGNRGKIGVISATWKTDCPVLQITADTKGKIEGRWYYVDEVRVPPRSLDAARALLNSNQLKNFERRFRAVDKHDQPRLFLFVWDRELGREALVVLAEKESDQVAATAVEVAPTDIAVLKLRAGADVETLSDKHVVVFGLGAVGSNLALRLAEVGAGRLVLVDDGILRPGDVVRHAAGSWAVGEHKATAVEFLAATRAPWATVTAIKLSPWDPNIIAKLLEGGHLTIDATGFSSFAALLSVMCADRSLPLLSVALYRNGFVGRVQRQALSSDTLICDRAGDGRYPKIPPGNEPAIFEPGCSAPVNNASPLAVSAIAALAGLIAVDHLTGRNHYPDEVVEVYQQLEETPFDKLGRIA